MRKQRIIWKMSGARMRTFDLDALTLDSLVLLRNVKNILSLSQLNKGIVYSHSKEEWHLRYYIYSTWIPPRIMKMYPRRLTISIVNIDVSK